MDSSSAPWQGRTDLEDGTQGRRWHQVIHSGTEQQDTPPGVALLGLASDLGVRLNKGRQGAAAGPNALRAALANMAWHHGAMPAVDCGDTAVAQDLATGQANYAKIVTRQLQAGHFVLGLGGGHEIAWASYQGCREYLEQQSQGQRLGILNFDAHFDLRLPAPSASSGTPFYQISVDCGERDIPFDYCCLGVARTANTPALFQRAEHLGVRHLLDLECRDETARELIQPLLAEVDALYVTVCLDVFPPGAAPGVSAPAAPGVDPAWVLRTLASVGQLCRKMGVTWLMADVAELAPPLDIEQRTARLGARVIDSCVAARFG